MNPLLTIAFNAITSAAVLGIYLLRTRHGYAASHARGYRLGRRTERHRMRDSHKALKTMSLN